MGRKILVAIDDGEESSRALSWCLQTLLLNRDDTLFLLHAKTPLPVYSALDSAGYLFSSSIITSMERYAKEVAEKVLEKASTLCTDFNSELKVEKMVENGDPRDVICEVAARLKVDLVVVGSHGYGPIKRAFLGSVSSQCAQTLKCPILIVKNPN
ncbi:uncharacterized protein LOC127262180 isoform X2 [Andrographis paniculata]|uniref:uncharacterized protein LOC127262180 isoform X2 n=1 Tax=Andrographis paniculata TaxID=175694 RepID=UPI0021E7CE89|nr:uncharacterized protein LOC127262180 isoform X2 [Andrographis paniculata]